MIVRKGVKPDLELPNLDLLSFLFGTNAPMYGQSG